MTYQWTEKDNQVARAEQDIHDFLVTLLAERVPKVSVEVLLLSQPVQATIIMRMRALIEDYPNCFFHLEIDQHPDGSPRVYIH